MVRGEKSGNREHNNEERTVICPVEGCEKEVLARGVHLHVMRSAGDGHGEQNDVPEHLSFDDLETAGSRRVEMDYPEERETEEVARMCPYCRRPFRGKNGVMIHLGQTAGRKNHPGDAADRHEAEDFPVVRVDENENIVEIVEDDKALPSTIRRNNDSTPEPDSVLNYIDELREKGLESEARRAQKILLGEDPDNGDDSEHSESGAAAVLGLLASSPVMQETIREVPTLL